MKLDDFQKGSSTILSTANSEPEPQSELNEVLNLNLNLILNQNLILNLSLKYHS